MAALSYAQRTGIGQHVDLAMINAMFFTDDYAHFQLEGANVLGGGGQVFDATGGQIMLAGDEKWYWRVLNTQGRGGGPDAGRRRPRRPRSRCAARRSRRSCSRSPTAASLIAKLNEVNLAWGEVHDHREVFDRQGSIEGREILTTVDDRAGGERRITNTPYRFSAAEAGVRGPAPYRGEHNYDAVADWLGDAAPDLDALHASGVLLQDDHARGLTKDR